MKQKRTKKGIDTRIGHRGDAIELITELLEIADKKLGKVPDDIIKGLEALLDAIQREIV